ncbi:MAG: transposase [Methylotenera sp.]|nr:transposase [Oligoflexia bacterium]
MRPHQYSEEFKRKAVQKVNQRSSGKSIDQVCEEMGITGPSFYDWIRKDANAPGMKKPGKRPQDWTPTEKFKAVLNFEALSESEQGEFPRSEGLHSEHLAAWKKVCRRPLNRAQSHPLKRVLKSHGSSCRTRSLNAS